ncbi:LysR family transcriptional regulator [Ruixingdingia sedimenti]|uniref:LysR family transcriptional regulator n=1 Tax=Ruixingdingia sedimenti TaxID=3073604 RepID=A0ABU1F5I9_9RHOB|nr:LysR family transcriptional regulator [Xinfangfangia sp. LG-4]MDR5652145.1 LysR family transcriptional regulator [Xinfangfangia sp. LG-4]
MTFNRLHLIRQTDLFSLKLFISAVEERQIGRAAMRENISASTATKRIQDLEEIAGIKLLERTPAGVTPTPAGQVLERYLRNIFGQLDDMRAEIAGFSEGVRGEITVASARSVIAPFLAKELGEFGREYPMVDLIVHEVENARIVQAVANGEAEIGVFAVTAGVDLTGVDVVPYREDRIVAVIPRSHPLAACESVTFQDLLSENLIPVHGMMGAFETASQRLGREFRPRYVTRSIEAAISLTQAGLGVTVQPECLVSRDLFDEVATVRLDEPWAKRLIKIATPRGRVPSRAAGALMAQLLDRPGQPARDRKAPRAG